MYSEYSLNELMGLIQNGTPVPGGGCVNALTGAIAASLVGLAANLTLAREKDAQAKEEMQNIVEDMAALQVQFSSLMDSDSMAYNLIQRAYEMKTDLPEERHKKVEEIQLALKNCIYVPAKIGKLALSLIKTIAENMPRFNSKAHSHAMIAAELAKSTITCASRTILLNLHAIKDREFVVEFKMLTESLGSDSAVAEQAIFSVISTD